MEDTGARLYSTLTRRKEPLLVGPDRTVRIYMCGPTVYGPIHVGNARPYVVHSVLKRFLERRGLRVRLVSNITDVNDKIYAAARREGVPSSELARRYAAEYRRDTDRLGLGRPDEEPTVTRSMDRIIALIGDLVDRGLAYPAAGDVYFRVRRFPGYGRLSGQRLDEMVSEEPGEQKEDPLDFALWKGRKADEDSWWDSPWGPGRPGWHIECSAMSEAALGLSFEVHGGGTDLIFPHHENEIAQTEGARGQPLAKIWMHNEMLDLGGDKMSKSVGNIAPLAEALDRWPRDTLLAFFLTSHYRSRLPFTEERLRAAGERVARLRNALRGLARGIEAPGEGYDPELAGAVVTARSAFFAALDDDLGTPGAFAALDELARAVNAAVEGERRPSSDQLREVRLELVDLLDVLGLAGLAEEGDAAPREALELLEQREAARAASDFARADEMRARLAEMGFVVRDTPEGPRLYPA
jgi:cysteinyl-tRNA synthetase